MTPVGKLSKKELYEEEERKRAAGCAGSRPAGPATEPRRNDRER